jgi:predicted ATP-binding protein involved in virulence
VLIKAVFKDTSGILIIAPCGFGKFTDLDMVKHLLEIQVDENRKPFEDIKDTQNYKLFTDNKLKITEVPAIMNLHFSAIFMETQISQFRLC